MNNEFKDKTVELEDNFGVNVSQENNLKEDPKTKDPKENIEENKTKDPKEKNKKDTSKKEPKDDKTLKNLLDEIEGLPLYKLVKRGDEKIIMFSKLLTDDQYYAVKRVVNTDKTGNTLFTSLNYN